MIQETTTLSVDHYQYVSTPAALGTIKEDGINIAILKRELDEQLAVFTQELINHNFAPLRTSLDVADFEHVFDDYFSSIRVNNSIAYSLLRKDISALTKEFATICNHSKLSIFFGVVNTNMCSRFHTDMYELRMISTYYGQGTMWLTKDNVNYDALTNLEGNEKIVLRDNDIKQLATTDVAIMKGDLYPNSKISGVVHKSPTIENLKQKRLILRVDSNSLFEKI